MRYSILAPAKVNLYLDVLAKRDDGYHEIKSVMQAVSLYDKISVDITKSSDTKIKISSSDTQIKWNESNLVYKACSLFLKAANISGYSFDFYVEKNIPVCAGMAGGSTDAAATLLLLNDAFNNTFSTDELCELGSILGADVAFCIVGGTCLCEGVGEKITPICSFSGNHIVCAIDDSSVSTPKAFAMLDEKYGVDCKESSDSKLFLSSIKDGNLNEICSNLYNKFENVIIPTNPTIQSIKKILMENGALGALMSGSGPSVFGVFPSEMEQKKAFDALQRCKIKAFCCKSL